MPFDPRGLTIERWSALTAAELQPFGQVPVQTDEEGWKAWAAAVKNLPALAPRFVPSAKGFGDWRDWALRLNEAMRGLGL
jgi:hypothetical protein